MMNTSLQKILFAGTSRLTEVSPVFGGRLLDSTVRPVLGSRVLSAVFEQGNRRLLKRMKTFHRFLVIADMHIGDAVMMQSALVAVREFFPDAEIDYVVNKAVSPLIEGNPDANRIIPVFSDGPLPSPADVETLRDIIREGQYDLCVNFCPFTRKVDLATPTQTFVEFLSIAPTIVRNDNDSAEINHFSYLAYKFVRGLLSKVARPVRADCHRGVRTTYSDEAIGHALQFMRELGVPDQSPIIMHNPDSAIKFNLMPFERQATLLGILARDTTADTTILLGAGHTEAGIGDRLANTIPSLLRSKVRIIPRSISLEVYSALIDFADVFLTGDTGPLHLAAARRYSRSGHYQFRNRTAVLSFFGATMPRMSGYDSFQPGNIPANQDAPSWCYQAASPCRNITCLNKMFKTCRTVRCFEQVDVAGLATLVVSHLNGLIRQTSAKHEEPPFAYAGC